MTPAKHLTDEAIAKEIDLRALQFAQARSAEGGGGSPGEWMWERIHELETEQKRRADGGEIDTTVPLQSK